MHKKLINLSQTQFHNHNHRNTISKSLGAHPHNLRVRQPHDPVEVDAGVGAPKVAPPPDDGRIVGALHAVEDARDRPPTKVVLRIAVDHRPDVTQELRVWRVVRLEKNYNFFFFFFSFRRFKVKSYLRDQLHVDVQVGLEVRSNDLFQLLGGTIGADGSTGGQVRLERYRRKRVRDALKLYELGLFLACHASEQRIQRFVQLVIVEITGSPQTESQVGEGHADWGAFADVVFLNGI